MISIPICTLCKNLIPEPNKGCKAYPEKIPDDIWSNKVYHVLPFAGDNGIMFEPYDDRIDVQAIIDMERERRARREGRSDKEGREPLEGVQYAGDADARQMCAARNEGPEGLQDAASQS